MTPKLLLEYQQKPRATWMGWALLGIALLLVVDVSVRKDEAEEQLAVWQSPQKNSAITVAATKDASVTGAAKEDPMQQAMLIMDQLALPWSPLFNAIEKAHTETVALLAVQPDAQRRSVTIIGEAKGYNEVLEYVVRLREEARLKNVYLVGNEIREDQPQRPVAFTVSADWKALQ
jgi:hypothetical protein